MSGIKVSLAGYPIGIRRYAHLFFGRLSNSARKFIGLGVWVNETKPAAVITFRSIPAAISKKGFMWLAPNFLRSSN